MHPNKTGISAKYVRVIEPTKKKERKKKKEKNVFYSLVKLMTELWTTAPPAGDHTVIQ